MKQIKINIDVEALKLFLAEYPDAKGTWSALEREQLAEYEKKAYGKKPNLAGCPECITTSYKKMVRWIANYEKETGQEQAKVTQQKPSKNKAKVEKTENVGENQSYETPVNADVNNVVSKQAGQIKT